MKPKNKKAQTDKEPTPSQAIDGLNWLLGKATYDDIDVSTDQGAKVQLARWGMAMMAIKRLRKLVAKGV